jgi:hypothetical protein
LPAVSDTIGFVLLGADWGADGWLGVRFACPRMGCCCCCWCWCWLRAASSLRWSSSFSSLSRSSLRINAASFLRAISSLVHCSPGAFGAYPRLSVLVPGVGTGPDALPAVGRGRGGPRGGHRAGLSVQRRVEPLQRTASPSPSRVRLVEAVQQCGRRGLAHRGGGLLFLTPCHLLEHPGDALVVLVPVRVEVRHGW